MIGRLIGNYKITAKLGEGGMGEVFRALDLMLEREVAIKALRPELARQPHVVERFRSEAMTLARLNHPRLATLYSLFRQGADLFMVMEYVPGRTLDAILRERGALACGQAVALLGQALDGIGYAHRLGIVHRDLKPANVMLTPDGAVKVMDFGIARALGSARQTREGRLIGTFEYMSPEQIRAQAVDTRSDIYALGILLYELLTGRVPFTSQSEYELMRAQIEAAPPPPRDFNGSIPPAIEAAILRALAKQPEDRFQSAEEFQAALLACPSAAAPSLADLLLRPAVESPGSPPPEEETAADGPGAGDDEPKATRLGAAPVGGQAASHAGAVIAAGSALRRAVGRWAVLARRACTRSVIGKRAIPAATLFAAVFGVSLWLMNWGVRRAAPVSPADSAPSLSQPSLRPLALGQAAAGQSSTGQPEVGRPALEPSPPALEVAPVRAAPSALPNELSAAPPAPPVVSRSSAERTPRSPAGRTHRLPTVTGAPESPRKPTKEQLRKQTEDALNQ